MGPSGWTTTEQREFLVSFKPEYEVCRVEKKYQGFWRKLFASFLIKFPLIEEVFPGRRISDLNEEERSVYTQRLDKLHTVSWCWESVYGYISDTANRPQRLKEWFRWQYNPRSRNHAVAISNKLIKQLCASRKRGPKAYEAYAKLYPEKVAAAQKQRCEDAGVSGTQVLAKWHAVCKDLLNEASAEELQAVDEKVAQMSGEGDEDDLDPEEFGPADFQRYVWNCVDQSYEGKLTLCR